MFEEITTDGEKTVVTRIIGYASVSLLCLAAITLVGLQNHLLGGLMLATGALSTAWLEPKFRRNLLLLFGSIGVLGLTPIGTDTTNQHALLMGMALVLAVSLPYLISRYVYRDYLVRFPFRPGRRWQKREITYIGIAGLVAYLLLPFYFATTGAHLNWTVAPGAESLARLFVGTNLLAIWDELFFVSTCLGILRHFLPFKVANLAQATLFASFLYELGFRSWGVLMVFAFALLQGYIFNKTESLLYVIVIHLTVDLILFLAILNAHHPDWMPIFVT